VTSAVAPLWAICEFEVTDTAKFKDIVHECVAIARQEPGTLAYEWFIDENGTEARLYEAYDSVEAIKEHIAGRVFSEFGAQLMAVCRMRKVDSFGDTTEIRPQLSLFPAQFWNSAFAGLAT
jgi:quinol monooxygenase YgiN